MLRAIFLILFIFPFVLFGQYNTIVSAEILVDENTEFLSLNAKATNISEVNQNLRYVFSVIKKNPDGSVASNTKQEGDFSLASFTNKALTETTINASEKEEIVVLLLVYNSDNKLLGKARWAQNEKEVNKTIVAAKQPLEEQTYDGILFRGLVTEDTRTKGGRDFYRIFNQLYFNAGINAAEIVTVKEFIAGRRNTRIEVRLGDALVAQFFVQPKEDYLKNFAQLTLKNIYRVIQSQRNVNQQIERY